MKIDANFDAREFIHPAFWEEAQRRDQPEFCLSFVSDFQIGYAKLIRNVLDAPIIINNWHIGGKRPYIGRGTRPAKYRPLGGAVFSLHYLALALDVSSPNYTHIQIYQAIQDNREAFLKIGLTTIENPAKTPGWLHGDCRRRIPGLHPDNGFLIVNP